ncbi:MAG: enoyl-CoA hydratase/isomerase family protein, partial [Burkholderiaceae bacterium]
MQEDSGISSGVQVRVEGAVCHLTLMRPERSNRLDWAMQLALLRAVREAAQWSDCRLLVLQGQGADFCAGDCAPDMGDWPDEYRHRRPQGTHGAPPLPLLDLLAELRSLSVPTLAVLQGDVADAGLDIASHCDIRLAAAGARFADRRVANARFVDSGLTYVLPRLIGQSRATKLMLLGETMDGAEAERIGLVYRAVPDAALQAAAAELAARLAALATRSYALVKQQILDQLDLSYRASLMHSMAVRQTNVIEDRAEGQRALMERRAPRYVG